MSTLEYRKANYDRVVFMAKKGKREEYKQAAEDLGLGQAEMIRLAVEEFIQAHVNEFAPLVKPAPMTAQPAQEKLTAEQRRLLDEFGRLPAKAQKHLLGLVQAVNEDKHAAD